VYFLQTAAEYRAVVPPDENSPAGSVLRDTLLLLGCREIKVSVLGNSNGTKLSASSAAGDNADGDAELLEDTAAPAPAGNVDSSNAAAISAAEKKLSRIVVDMMIPVLLSLKTTLEKQQSPFLRYLRICLNEVRICFVSNFSRFSVMLLMIFQIFFSAILSWRRKLSLI
jgi:hypothetical protein